MTSTRKTDKKDKPKGILHFLGLGLSFGLLAFVALVGMLVIVLPAMTGSTPYTVLTTSMEPHYGPGTLVIIKPTPAEDIQVGEIITYQLKSGEPAVVTHRVIEKTLSSTGETRFITQGDNNGAPDEAAVRPVQIRGTLWYAVPYIGWVNNLVNGAARSIVIPLIAIALFLYAGFMFTTGMVAAMKKKRGAASMELLTPTESDREADRVEAPQRDRELVLK